MNYTNNSFNLLFSSYILPHLQKEEQSADLGYTITGERIFIGFLRIQETDTYVLLGPTAAFEITISQAQNILKSLALPSSRINELVSALNRYSRYTIEQSKNILTLLDFLLNNRTNHEVVYFPTQNHSAPQENTPLQLPFVMEIDKSTETEMLSYIEYGRTDLLQNALGKLFNSGGDIPEVSSDVEHAMKKLFIVNVGVVSRTALKGGIDYGTMTEMSTYYLKKIDEVSGFNEISNLIYKMFMSFAHVVAMQKQIPTNTMITGKIRQVVFAHINEKITPTLISEIINMDLSYICRHFKKDTGMTISTYINHVKISECRRLLSTTDLSILDISIRLGYTSHNYMSTMFKKIVGMTPEDYRKNG